MNENVFGNRLRALLEDTELEGQEFAKLMHIQPPTLSNWLNGNRFPKEREMLIKLAEYFDVTVDYLLGKTDIKNPYENKDTTKKEKNPLLEDIDNLSEESIKELENYIRLLKIKDEMDKGKEEQSSVLERLA